MNVRSLFGPRRTVSGAPTSWDAGAYLVTDLLIAIPAFTLIVTFLSLSFGLAITFFLALPFFWATIWCARIAGALERWRLWAFLDRDVPAPQDPPQSSGLMGWLRANGGHRPFWREVGYTALHLPVACLTFAAVVTLWAVPLGLITMPLYINALPSEKLDFWVGTVRPGGVPYLLAVLGLALLPLCLAAVRRIATVRAQMSQRLLSPSPGDALRERVQRLETTRSQAVDAAEGERRRIERDLHDGAQQRLIALAMDLGMAREKLAADPETARVLIDEAHQEAKNAITELRDLARGIHPAVLTDRGLGAALASMASRSPVPVTVDVTLDTRPPETIEGIAYFIVSEALANVAKHAQAKSARVAAAQRGSRLILEISDDGVGGASLDKGTGLRGLADRVATIDGWFHISSPNGGPTTLTVELPCE